MSIYGISQELLVLAKERPIGYESKMSAPCLHCTP